MRALGHPGFQMSVFDPDTVSATNTVRQRFWPADLGQNKAELLIHRYGTFGGLNGQGYAEALTVSALVAIHRVDLLVTCVDKAQVRREIGAHDWHLDPYRWVAVAACDLLWQLVRHGTIGVHGFFINPTGVRVSELAIDPRTWASFGLVAGRQAA